MSNVLLMAVGLFTAIDNVSELVFCRSTVKSASRHCLSALLVTDLHTARCSLQVDHLATIVLFQYTFLKEVNHAKLF